MIVYSLMLTVLVVGAGILVIGVRKRIEFFSVSVIAWYLGYCVFGLINIDKLFDKNKTLPEVRYQQVYTIYGTTLQILAHWAYASQYIKTTIILPRLLNLTKLILTQQQACNFGD